MILTFKAACLSLVASMGLVQAQNSPAASVMTGFDTNKDGKISLEELKEHVGNNPGFAGWEAGFKEADANKDGHLTLPELESLLSHATKEQKEEAVDESEETIAKSIMDGFDTDKDGKLSLTELKEHVGGKKELHAAFKGWEEGFAQADADKDEHLTVHELAGLLKQVSIDDQKEMVEESEHTLAKSIMDGFDTNKDGKLSLKELKDHVGDNTHVHAAFAGWTAGFKEADQDSDGHLTLDELASMLAHVSREDQQEMVHESEESLAASVMDGFDADKDGKLSLKELEDHVGDKKELHAAFQGWQQGFKEADADSDGYLTTKELASLLAHVSNKDQADMVHESEKTVGESIMDGFDTDKDGKLTLKELMDHVGDHEHVHAAFEGWQNGFTQADRNSDGHLTASELTWLIEHVSRQDQEKMLRESHKEVSASILDGFDTNKDGKIALKELMEHVGDKTHVHAAFAGWTAGFKQADADNDGHLDAEELTNLISLVSREEQQEMVEESHDDVAARIMDGFDTDKDGKLTLKELKDHVGEKKELHAAFEGWEAGFAEADADKDEHLTVKELSSLLSKVSRKDQAEMTEESEKSAGEQIMDGFDADKDGKLSLQELMEHVGDSEHINAAFEGWKEGFKQADKDEDGHLTAQELTDLLSHVSRLDQEKMQEESKAQMASYFKDSFDADKNGKLSLDELKKHMDGDSHMHKMFAGWEDGFKEADADGDEHLSDNELSAFLAHAGNSVKKSLKAKGEKRMVKSMIRAYDKDKDKHVSMKEIVDHMSKQSDLQHFLDGWKSGFRDADADFDGLLDEEEMGSLLAHVNRHHRHKLINEGDAVAEQAMGRFDADKDGKISMKELEEKVGNQRGFKGWEGGFKEADADKDGHLSADELVAWFKLLAPEVSKHDEM